MNKENRSNRIVSTWVAIAAVVTVAVHIRAATLYVSQTSPNPSPPYSTPDTAAHTIQQGVDASNDGDTVLVAPGDYNLTNQVTVTKGIALQGTGGASQTFLTAAQNNIWCLWISNALAVADGFSLQQQGFINARGAFLVGGTMQNCNFSNFFVFPPGASLAMSDGTLSNSIVSWRRAPDGIAITCSNGLIIDSQILAQSGGSSGTAVSLVNSLLQNSVVSGTPSPGNRTGVAVSALSSTVVDCTISNNFSIGKGAGAYLENSLMDRCVVTGNTSGSSSPGFGGGGVFETNSIVRNSLIVGNRARVSAPEPQAGGLGGGVYMQGGALLNCTVSSNSAQEFTGIPGGGGGVYAESGGITNSIIFSTRLRQVTLQATGSTPEPQHSTIVAPRPTPVATETSRKSRNSRISRTAIFTSRSRRPALTQAQISHGWLTPLISMATRAFAAPVWTWAHMKVLPRKS